MAPKYLMRIVREPMPGKAFELMEAVIEQRKQMGIAEGLTTVSIASPRMLVVSSTPYEELSELEARVGGIFDREEARASWDKVGSLASSTVNNLSRVIVPPEGIETANYIQRYIFNPAPGSRRNLLAALVEFAEQSEGPRAGITGSVNSPAIVASIAVGSLSDLEGGWDRLQNDAGTMTRANSVVGHCESWTSGIARVVSRP